jgi:hypothetical protein
MNGDREPGFPRGLFGASEEMEALLVDIRAVLARHGFRGMAIEAIELYPVTDPALDGGAASIQGYVRSSALPRPDIPSYPLDPGVDAFIKAGPARRCPDGKPAVFRCFATPDGKVQCRWVCA